MKLTHYFETHNINNVIQNADELCKTFDPSSNCTQFINEKLTDKKCTAYTLINDNDECAGIAIIEILDKYYGNLIVHTLSEKDETILASHLIPIIKDHVLELIQFRSNFTYRDTFIHMGFKEKERARMIHHDIGQYAETEQYPNISFSTLTDNDHSICGDISYNAHKHRQHIECYEVYNSIEKRAEFAKDLRSGKHGKSITDASLLMKFDGQPMGLIDVVEVPYNNQIIGWIMDVCIRPEFQGMGLGQQLIKKSLSNAYQAGFAAVGLGVTLTNKGAHQLYQNLGFEDYEIFVEILSR